MLSTVYRIEDSTGYGPYCLSYNEEPVCMTAMIDYHNCIHPTPKRDTMIGRWHNEINESYGFVSLRQLLNWFTFDNLHMLADCGFFIVQFKAEITAKSEHQVLYDRDTRI